jgi:4'-phosphopantetheinyl transferase
VARVATAGHALNVAGSRKASRRGFEAKMPEAAGAAPWRIADGRATLRPGELHVWQCDLDREYSEPDAAATLSDAELSRAARLVFARDRRRFCAGRLALRRILSRYTGVPAAALPLGTRGGGKPYLAGHDLEFNVAHSQHVWVCAITGGTPVGVDVEGIRPVADCLSLARHHFSPVEADAVAAVPAERRERAFLGCWTRKEAYLKLLGLGITAGLGAFVAGFGPGDVTVASIAPEMAGDVHVRTFLSGPGVIGALAFMEKPSRIEYFIGGGPGSGNATLAR